MAEGTRDRTVLFADVVDSTRLYEELGDESARRLLIDCLELMEATVKAVGGHLEARIGDEILCTFEDPEQAAEAAGRLQEVIVRGLSEGRFPREMRIRVGLEHGPVLETEEGLFGGTVHAAARLVALAKAGQILTSRQTLERLSLPRQRLERFFDRLVLKGQAGETEVHELLWDTTATIMPGQRPKARSANVIQAVVLHYGGVERRVDASEPRLDVGRDAACGLRVRGDAVSRLHARVLWNRGQVRVEDVSTNGTGIEQDGKLVQTLHREGAKLSGEGVLRLGVSGPPEASAAVRFVCEPGS